MRFFAAAALTGIMLTYPVQSFAADPLNGVFACAGIADSVERLACYDSAVSSLQQAEATGELVTVTRADIAEVERDAFGFNLPSLPKLGGVFGGLLPKRGEDTASARSVDLTPRGDKLTAPVVTPTKPSSVRTAEVTTPQPRRPVSAPAFEEVRKINQPLKDAQTFGYDKTRFVLANGQVWDQVDTNRVRIPRERDGRTNTVEIRKAAAGSFLLQVNGKGTAIRVRRRR